MRVLHFLSDWKWTGPAEPVVRLCRALRDRGVEIEFLCKGRPQGRSGGVIEKAADMNPMTPLRLRDFTHPLAYLLDIRDLAPLLDEAKIDIVHTHMTHDHAIGSRAARRSARRPIVVRTNHTGVPLQSGYWTRHMVRGHTDGMIEISRRAFDADGQTFGLSPEQMILVEGSVNLSRFFPGASKQNARPGLRLASDDIVVGMVARIQRHRRFHVFLKAMKIATERNPALRGLIVGRGTHRERIAVRPARRMGLSERVIFAGYRTDDYVSVLDAIDMLVFLVPGSDGSCRAVREAMAMGKPIIAARRGLLPELVEDGVCGLVVDDSPENLASAILRLAEDADLRKHLGAAAARKAAEKFGIDQQAEAVLGFYQSLMQVS